MDPLKCLAAFCALAVTATASVAAPTDACAILTPAEVSAILGVPVGPGEPMMPTVRTVCTFNETGSASRWVNAQIIITDAKTFARNKTPVEHVIKAPEPGIGDEAYWSEYQQMVPQLYVRKGSAYFMISARTGSPGSAAAGKNDTEGEKAATRKLAAAILKKL